MLSAIRNPPIGTMPGTMPRKSPICISATAVAMPFILNTAQALHLMRNPL